MTRNKIVYTITAALLAVVVFIFSEGSGVLNKYTAACAEVAKNEIYTSVTEDLTAAEFDFESCPAISNDYTLQVKQIAESNYGELFVYVYQPAAESLPLTATSINISTAINESLSYTNYKLRLLSSSGVLAKYLVEGLAVKSDALRYYDISSIYRAWNEELDDGLPEYNENNITEVAFEVAQRWTACTVNGEVSYDMTFQDTVYITDKYVGYIRYTSDHLPEWLNVLTAGTLLRKTHYDSHYIAFSCDYEIDRLLEADVYYVSQSCNVAGYVPVLGKKIERSVTLAYTDKKTVEVSDGSGLTIKRESYTWNRIERVSEFMAHEELTDEAREDLTGKQWILRFTETTTDIVPILATMTSTNITDVTIFRLKFEADGEPYNLGVVDNKQSPAFGQLPDNPQPDKSGIGFWEYIWQCIVKLFSGTANFVETVVAVVAIFITVSLLPLLMLLLSIFFPAFRAVLLTVLKAIGTAILWLISAPFRFIAWIVKKVQERREGRKQAQQLSESKPKSKSKKGKKNDEKH